MIFCLIVSAEAASAKKGVKAPSPSLAASGDAAWTPYWRAGFEDAYRTLLKNLHGPNLYSSTRYAYPSPTFRGIYLWDSAFISQVWRPWDAATAEEVTWSMMSRAAPDGRIPHFSGPYSSSDWTQPPVLAWATWQNYLWSGDRERLALAYPKLKAYNQWLYEKRRLPGGLFFWLHPYESGIDNSPRFGSADESEVADMMNLAAVDLNSYMALQNLILGRMAAELGQPGEETRFNNLAIEQAALINDFLWDPETGLYYDRDMKSGQLIKVKTIASLLPLFAGVPDEKRAEIMVGHVMNPAEFNTLIPLPSVARDDPSFEKDCWRGPVWVNTAYMVIDGIAGYGYEDEAAKLTFKLVDGVYHAYRDTGRLVEFYDPDRTDFVELHRKRGNLYKQITLGGKPRPNFVGWTGLVNTLVIEQLVGFHKVPGAAWLKPNFPPDMEGVRLELILPGEKMSIEIEFLDSGRSRGVVTRAGKTIKFELEKGEKLEL